MMRPAFLIVALGLLLAPVAQAAVLRVESGPGALQNAIAGADPGDVLMLEPGTYVGNFELDRPLTIDGQGAAILDGGGTGSVVTITGQDITLRGLEVRHSGRSHETIDSGIRLLTGAERVLIENNTLSDNLHGIDFHGSLDSVARGNVITGRRDAHMNDRGNGFYVWNAPGTVIDGNSVRYGRDGIFSNASREGTYTNNLFRDLRFAVHYMYTHTSTISDNVSIGNTLGFALMYSNRIIVENNLTLADRAHGVMLNYSNDAVVKGNLVRGGTHQKCTFIFNAHKNRIEGNRFEGCGIGIHFTAGSERNEITGNAFIANRTQVKYVGTRHIEWSSEGRGNFWSDHVAFDLDGDGLADSPFRPNDLMDHILWSQPSAKLLLGSPAVQLVRWSQAAFPATLPGGVMDSAPLMEAPAVAVPDEIAALEAEALARAPKGSEMSDAELLSSH